MRKRLNFFGLLVLFLSFGTTGMDCGQNVSSAEINANASVPLRVRVRTVAWTGNCLKVTIARTNRSSSAIFLPYFGVSIESSVSDATNTLGQGAGQAWLSAMDGSDILVSTVTRLAPAESRNDAYCISDTITVEKRGNKMRRQVPLRGSLRISAGYFPEAQRWQTSNSQREAMATLPRSKWTNLDRSKPGTVTIEFLIPCHPGEIHSDCASPPPVFAGERRPPVPDTGN